ncbi:helix-turn-helix domain-containing protein [Bacillus wiedmannii]|uniref:helix-turn-helix domain-containing protein n=1 Tax=Bacillus wiedmannii TaxID=1890302 RepID=UPI000B437D84|nr:helix-turn-helix domain-containing protein [Bacillus wiedmannii]OUB82989.1 transcriptional regulator [Bacillus thuringiensis serovar sinensis]MCU5114973.1 helix-turn-helix transcriptional regulator [Bacillus wiedmannii]MCU5152788.1 helix-turn-helix transcriptional regulator [Bacillus wiedmannii]MCU5412216.1 helix-turn-helix transcriptional regulator [Bacillus wiedmannii]PEO39645.1 helix-turn-helix domain-containing protein [Bacillus wiedmannii]
MHAEKLGSEIKKIRVMRGLTQKQLSDNVCHQSEVSRIESGAVYPSMDILQGIAAKLQVPIIHFYEVLIYSDIERNKQLKDQIIMLCKQKKYKEIYNKVCNELKKEEYHPELQQFLQWQYYVAAYILKKIDYEYCILELKKLLNQQLTGIDVYQNLYIENAIANIYAENGYLKKGIDLFENILKQLEALHDNKEFDVKVRHNHAKALYSDNQYKEALCHANKAIELSCQINSMTLIGQLYFRKGECLAKLGCDRAEIEDAYEKACFFFDILGNHALKESIIKKMKK